MFITVSRESPSKRGMTVWEFSFLVGATELDRFRLELVSYTKYKKSKGYPGWREIGRWSIGWNCSLDWTDIRLPIDVVTEVKEKLSSRVEYMRILAGNNPLPVSLIKEYEGEVNTEGGENE